MNTTLKPLAFATLCLVAACALAYTSKPCEPSTPTTCTGQGNGAQCGGGNVITFGPDQPFAYYYCGGNTAGRCGGPNGQGTCSEILFKTGTAHEIFCGSKSLGWCFNGAATGPTGTGYDCGNQPCPDVPNRIIPNYIGTMAPCNLKGGYPFPTIPITEPCPPASS